MKSTSVPTPDLEASLKELEAHTTEPLDFDELEKHLTLAGFEDGDSVIFASWQTTAAGTSLSHQFYPRQDFCPPGPNTAFGFIVGKPLPPPENWEFSDFPGVTVWGAKTAHIKSNAFAFVDCDSEVLTAEEQFEIVEKAGLPTPSFVVDTTGRGLHFYWLYDQPLPPDEHKSLMRRIANAFLPWPEFKVDRSVCNPSRIIRVAGSRHPKTGKVVRVQHETGSRYTPEDFNHLPPVSQAVVVVEEDYDSAEEDADIIRDILQHLPATPEPEALEKLGIADYDYWIKTGMALKKHGFPMSAWDEWSQDHPKYLDGGRDQIPGKWASFDSNGEAGISFLVKASQLHGYDPHRLDSSKLGGFCSRGKQKMTNADLHQQRKKNRGDWLSAFEWVVDNETTLECLIERAFKVSHAHEDSDLIYLNGSFRRYDPERGFYAHVSLQEIERLVQGYLRRAYSWVKVAKDVYKESFRFATTPCLNRCVKWLETALAVDSNWADGSAPVIAFRNGAMKKVGDTWLPVAFSKKHRLLHALDCDYDPSAECPPLFREFVRTSYGEELLNAWRALFNYHADPTFHCRIFLFLLGNSGQGKGVMLRLLSKLYPQEIVRSLSNFGQIATPEQLAQHVTDTYFLSFPDLQGKQEAPGSLLALSDYKQSQAARYLHSKDGFSFQFRGRVVIASTQLPNMQSAQTGFKRRVLVVKVRDKRLSSDVIPSAPKFADIWEDDLAAELGKIVSWALAMPTEEVAQVLDGDHPVLQETKKAIEASFDSIHEFADRCLVPTEDTTYIPDTADLYAAYRLFVHFIGQKNSCNMNSFKSRLRQMLEHLHRDRIRLTDRTIPAGFFGLKLADGLWSRNFMDIEQQDAVSIRGEDNLGVLNRKALLEEQLRVLEQHKPEPPTARQFRGETASRITRKQVSPETLKAHADRLAQAKAEDDHWSDSD